MQTVPEYDGYLELDDDQLRESFIQLNENIRALEQRFEANETLIRTLRNDLTVLGSVGGSNAGGGVYVKLDEFNADNVTPEIIFDTSSGFNSNITNYMIISDNLVPNARPDFLNCQFSVNGSFATYTDSTNRYYYKGNLYYVDGNSVQGSGQSNSYSIQMNANAALGIAAGADNPAGVQFNVYLNTPQDAGQNFTTMKFMMNYVEWSASGGTHRVGGGGGYFSTTSPTQALGGGTYPPIDGIKFSFSTAFAPGDNMASLFKPAQSGKVTLYGLI